jgi:hypothetical protein
MTIAREVSDKAEAASAGGNLLSLELMLNAEHLSNVCPIPRAAARQAYNR